MEMKIFKKISPLILFFPLFVFAARPPSTAHPSWQLINLRPTAGFQPMVGGMDFLSDGRLVIGHWNGTRALCCPSGNFGGRQYTGKIYILSGVSGNTPTVVVDSTFATGLEDIMGLTVVRDTIYVSGGNNIIRLVDSNNDGRADRKDTIFTYPGLPQISSSSSTAPGPGPYGDSLHPVKGRSEWMYGLLARNDTFFVNPSSMYNASNTQQVNPKRGVALAVTKGNGIRGNYQILGMGLRHPTGLSFGPEGTVWTTETQGHWLPTNKLIQIKPGSFYGFRHTPAESWENLPETPAAVFLPEDTSASSTPLGQRGVVSNSPGAPFYMTTGPYAGQFLMGDVSWGGIQRMFVEKVNGDYQGAVFLFMGGLEGGVYRIAQGPDGMLYLGMVGAANDWEWNGNLYGLQKMKYSGTPTFEMQAVRSRAAGMEIEFTLPVDTTIAKMASSYTVQTFYYQPTSAYGGNPINNAGTANSKTTVTVQSVQISPDHKSVFLSLPMGGANGLQARVASTSTTPGTHRIVYIKLNNYKSATNTNPWTTETWYSLNSISTSAPFDGPTSIDPAITRANLQSQLRCRTQGNSIIMQAPFHGDYQIRIRDLRGILVASHQGHGAGEQSLALDAVHGRFMTVEVSGEGVDLRRTVMVP